MSYSLTWDASGERRFETGVDHGVLYTGRGQASSKKAFTTAAVWNGLTSVTETPSGADANDLYADNIKYATLRSPETFGGTIESYTYPDAFSACNGEKSPTSLTGVYVGQQAREPFGFCYRSDIGDDLDSGLDTESDYMLHLWWNCTASPSERQYQTINDSPDAITFSWEVTTTPISFGEGFKPAASMTIDTTRLPSTNNLDKLLAVLYGGTITPEGGTAKTYDACLPTPAEVISILSTGNIPSEFEHTT